MTVRILETQSKTSASNEHGGDRNRLTQAERKALSDTRMFDAAMHLISRSGANHTTLKDICELAGYSRGLANYRFGSKNKFLEALLKHFNQVWEAHLDDFVKPHKGIDAILAANKALESFLMDRADDMRTGYTIWYEHIGCDNSIRDKLQVNHQTYRRDISNWVQEAIKEGEVHAGFDVDSFANFYCSFTFGTIFQWLANPEAVNLSKLFSYFRGQIRTLLATPCYQD